MTTERNQIRNDCFPDTTCARGWANKSDCECFARGECVGDGKARRLIRSMVIVLGEKIPIALMPERLPLVFDSLYRWPIVQRNSFAFWVVNCDCTLGHSIDSLFFGGSGIPSCRRCKSNRLLVVFSHCVNVAHTFRGGGNVEHCPDCLAVASVLSVEGIVSLGKPISPNAYEVFAYERPDVVGESTEDE